LAKTSDLCLKRKLLFPCYRRDRAKRATQGRGWIPAPDSPVPLLSSGLAGTGEDGEPVNRRPVVYMLGFYRSRLWLCSSLGSAMELLFPGADAVLGIPRRLGSSSSLGPYGEAMVCRRTEVIDSAGRRLEEVIIPPLRLWFLLSLVGDDCEAGWILSLKDASGKSSVCSMSPGWVLWGHPPACGWASCSEFSSLRMLLLCFLCLLVLWSGASGSGIWMAHIQGGCWWLWGQIVGSDHRFPFNEYFLRFTKAWCPAFDLFRRDGWFDVPGCRRASSEEGAAFS